MKPKLPRATLPLLAITASLQMACGSTEERPDRKPHGHWQVEDGMLLAPDGRSAFLRGVNLASAHKVAPYFGFHRSEDFLRVRQEFGMNSVRLLMTWAAIEPTPGTFDESYLDALEQRLDWAAEAGLGVVLDMHQDLYGEGFNGDGAPRWTCDEAHYAAYEPTDPWFLGYLDPNVVACFDTFWSDEALQGHYFEAWRRVARRFARHPAVVGFDPMNEPFWGSTEVTHFESVVLQGFYERAVAAIRSEARHWIAFLEPSSSRNLGVPTSLSKPSFDNVVYAPHSYDLAAEAGNGFDPARRQQLIDNVALMRGEADRLGAALWIGEYGANAALPGTVEYMSSTYDAVANVLAGSMYWAYDRDSGYGLFDSAGNEKTELLDVVVRPYPELVNGTPQSISFDAQQRVFELSFEATHQTRLPTVISVPQRSYPAGYQVECEGCRSEPDGNRLHVFPTREARDVRVRISPDV